MTDDEIIAAVLQKPEGPERWALLSALCVNDPLRIAHLQNRISASAHTDEHVQVTKPADSTPELNLQFLQPGLRPDSLGRLGHYEVLAVLGQGGFGIVFRAFDDVLQRVVAVKVLAPEMAASSPARKRFLREARAAAPIRHPNVVQVYAIEAEPVPYLVMEFIPGRSLQQMIDQTGPFDVIDVIDFGIQMARGLAAAHALGMVHRDIKPANILIEEGPERRVKITDFGLARAADDASLTQSGYVAGTPMFMSPEQAFGEAIDGRSDLFSLGSVLYNITTGRPPFRADSNLAVMKRVTEDTPRPIRELIPEAPEWLCMVIAKLHAKKPEHRFRSATELVDALANPTSPTTDEVPVQTRLEKRHKAPLLALLVALAVVVGVFLWQANQAKTTPPPKDDHSTDTPDPGAVVPPKALEKTPTGDAFTNALGMKFVRVPQGVSWQGGEEGKWGNTRVELPHDVFLGKYEVTQEEWLALMDVNPSYCSRSGELSDLVAQLSDDEVKRLPADSMSWQEAVDYLKRLNDKFPVLGWKYRLPTSKEWEYACRGGPIRQVESGFSYYFNKPTNLLGKSANLKSLGLDRSQVVGSFPANRLGLHDMHGNVFEFALDTSIDEGKTYSPFRGGCWHDQDEMGYASRKNAGSITGHFRGAGFRVLLEPVSP